MTDAHRAGSPDVHAQVPAETVTGRAARWKKVLLSRCPQERNKPAFTEWHRKCAEPNQRVIRADVDRTRANTEHFRRTDVREKMEAMLTCWCQQHQARYKQGLNEVLAPFMYLQTEPAEEAPDDDTVFNCFCAFSRRFVPFFDSEDFVPLQCAFVFFRRLLLYHHPDLHNLLVERGISPDMFCTPWFLTLFASKTPLRLTLHLWDRILERGEPPFFIFLAVALLGTAQQAIFSAERSALPEILTALGLTSREDLERVWSTAEALQRSTPATFAARLRRNVLKGASSGVGRDATSGCAGGGDEAERHAAGDTGRLLERLEQERCFFILPEEVVGHCYPPRAGEARQPWHPAPLRSWRLLVVDLRPQKEFEAARLPAALHLEALAAPPPGALGSRGAAWAAGRRLFRLGMDQSSVPEPAVVFEALKATLGENWVCDREAHICLLGASDDASLVRSLYEIMTSDLTLRHISVANGGYEAVVACAKKQGYEIVLGEESGAGPEDCRAPRPPRPVGLDGAPAAPEGSAAAATAAAAAATVAAAAASFGVVGEGASGDDRRLSQRFSSAWTSLRKVAAGAAGVAGVGPRSGEAAEAGAAEGAEPAPNSNSIGDVGLGTPTITDLPGNWPGTTDLASLPRRQRKDLEPADLHWPCIAVVIRCGEQCPALGISSGTPWVGCRCVLSIVDGYLVCSEDSVSDEVLVYAEVPISRVLRVTSKKQAADVLIFYLRDQPLALRGSCGESDVSSVCSTASSEGSPEPAIVLFFTKGPDAVRGFIKALRSSHNGIAPGARFFS